MSLWTRIRDAVETGAAVVSNYFYPGSGMAANWINSKGSQQQLFGTDWGRAAMLLSGVGGGMAGNFANYGTTANAIMGAEGGAWPSAFAGSAGGVGGAAGGAGGFGGGGGGATNPPGILPQREHVRWDGYFSAGRWQRRLCGRQDRAWLQDRKLLNVFNLAPYGGAGGPWLHSTSWLCPNRWYSGYHYMDAISKRRPHSKQRELDYSC
jgi:hypothetical protein